MSFERGCQNVIETCMAITAEDRVVIVSDDDSIRIGNKLRDCASHKTETVDLFNLDTYGKRPLDHMPEEIGELTKRSTATFWTASSPPGELKSLRMPFIEYAIDKGRHAHMVSITEDIIKRTLTGDYKRLESFTKAVHALAEKTKTVRITSKKGTDLSCDVGRYRWIAGTGIIRGMGLWNNLPDGEIFTTPYNMEGVAVIDGTIGDYFDKKYSLDQIIDNPVRLKISGKDPSRLIEVSCDNEVLEKDIISYVDSYTNSRKVGELGIGTNVYIEKLIGTMLVDEKYPGIHLAFGDPLGSLTKANWKCPTHLDMIVTSCDIWFDDTIIMENGKYLEGELDL